MPMARGAWAVAQRKTVVWLVRCSCELARALSFSLSQSTNLKLSQCHGILLKGYIL